MKEEGHQRRWMEEELEALRIEPEEKGPPEGRRRWLTYVAIGLALSVVVVAAFFAWQRFGGATAVEVAQTVLQQEAGGATLLTAGGYVVPERYATVSAKIAGQLVQLAVKEGDAVTEGQVIARLDDRELQAQVERAEASLGLTRATLARIRVGARREEVHQTEARLTQAQANLANAERRLRRAQELFRQQLISPQERDEVEALYETARAQVRVAEESLRIARVGPTPEELAEAQARVRLAEKELAYAKAQLENAVIRAPMTGTVIDRKAQVGDMLFPGEPEFILPGLAQVSAKRWSAIVKIAELTELNVEVDLNEADLPKVHVRQKVTVVPDSAPGKTYEGEVIRLYPMADRQKKTVQVKVRIRDPDEAVRPEVTARVNFLREPAKAPASRAVLVPKAALVGAGDENERAVFMVKDGRAHRRTVEVGAPVGDRVEVLAGMNPGETVVIKGQEQLKDGDRVTIRQ